MVKLGALHLSCAAKQKSRRLTMTRTTSIVLLSIITVLVLFLGVFSFIGTFTVGEDGSYYASPSHLIQKSNGLTKSVEIPYTVVLDGVQFAAVQKTIKARLRSAYGYYGVGISFNEKDSTAKIRIPVTNHDTDLSSTPEGDAINILKSVVANGNVEILNSTSYSEDSVILKQEHFKRARVRRYVNGTNSWNLVEIKLTSKGVELADKNFTSGNLSYYFAIDGEAESYFDYSGGMIRLYAHELQEAKLFASYINYKPLNATFDDSDEPAEIQANFGWLFLLIVGVLFVGSVAYLVVRYKDLGLVAALGQLLAIVVFTIFAGLVYLEMLNIYASIGIVLGYAFMTFFTVFTFEKIRAYLNDGKTYTSSRYKGFLDTWKVNLIAHGALLVLGVILWVIPTVVTAPLGNVLVYGAILSFAVTFGLNRLFTHMLSPFHEGRATARNAKK